MNFIFATAAFASFVSLCVLCCTPSVWGKVPRDYSRHNFLEDLELREWSYWGSPTPPCFSFHYSPFHNSLTMASQYWQVGPFTIRHTLCCYCPSGIVVSHDWIRFYPPPPFSTRRANLPGYSNKDKPIFDCNFFLFFLNEEMPFQVALSPFDKRKTNRDKMEWNFPFFFSVYSLVALHMEWAQRCGFCVALRGK